MNKLINLRHLTNALRRLLCCLPLLTLTVLVPTPSHAASFTFGGFFGMDDAADAVWLNITDVSTIVNLQTTSFATGGFAPVISVFAMNATGPGGPNSVPGDLLGLSSPGVAPDSCGLSGIDPATGWCMDAALALTLDPGLYLAVITQDPNRPAGLTWTDGYTYSGTSLLGWTYYPPYAGSTNFTGDIYAGNPDLAFILWDGSQRTGSWSLTATLSGDSFATATPEPGTLSLIGVSLVALAFGTRRRRRSDIITSSFSSEEN